MGAFDVAGHGRPVIITGWGGHLDYLPKDLGYLVAYRLEPVREYPNRSSYRSQKQWALADLNDAIRLLRHVRDHPGEAANQRPLDQVHGGFLDPPIVPEHHTLAGKEVELVSEKTAVGLLGAQSVELDGETLRVIVIVIVLLADEVVGGKIATAVTHTAEGSAARLAGDANHGRRMVAGDLLEAPVAARPAVVNDDELGPGDGLGGRSRRRRGGHDRGALRGLPSGS